LAVSAISLFRLTAEICGATMGVGVKTILLVALGCCFAGVHGGTPKDSVLTKTKTLLTSFPTDSQITKIWDTVAVDCYNMKTLQEMGNSIVDTVLKSLTGTQLVQGMQIYNKLVSDLGGSDKAKQTLNKVIGVAVNNLSSITQQIQDKVKSMKAAGKTQAVCIAQQYSMTNQFLTLDRVKTVASRVKAKLTPTEWSVIRKDLDSVAFFSKWGV
jgi:hypothetical protein